jgi:hypothetical protein
MSENKKRHSFRDGGSSFELWTNMEQLVMYSYYSFDVKQTCVSYVCSNCNMVLVEGYIDGLSKDGQFN